MEVPSTTRNVFDNLIVLELRIKISLDSKTTYT